jgi:general secretion pathway protein D
MIAASLLLPLLLTAPLQRPASPAAGPQDSVPAAGQPRATGQDEVIPSIQEAGDFYVLNLDETGEGIDLEWLTKLCQTATGINFTYDEPTATQLSQTRVRLFGEKRIPKEEFYSFYQIIMFINQFILTKVGPDHLAVVLVQPLQPQGGARPNLRNEAIYLLPEELEQYSDQVATQVITVMHLPHTDVRTLGNSLRGLTSDASGTQGVIPVGNTNSVILQGFASTVASLARILRLVDEESARDTGVSPLFEVIPLQYAAAEDLSDILEQLLEAQQRNIQQRRNQQAQGATGQIQAGGGETKILTDPRTNSLLVMALPEDMNSIKQLVARLDVELVEPERTYHVYALDNVRAEDLADTLEEFLEDASRVQQAVGGSGRRAGEGAVPGGTSRDSEIVVVPDPSTNSLLIAASRRRYEEVEELVFRLDQRQDQVLIETALIELSAIDSMRIGVELGLADAIGNGGFGVTSFGLSTIQVDPAGITPTTRIPNQSFGITAGIIDADDFSLPVMIAAATTRSDTNVLNIPSVLVNNNGSATVTSTESQPTTEVTQGNVTSQETFGGYEDAGITMQISPSISASGYLRLDVTLEVSIFSGTFSGPIPPPKVTRTIQTSVSVPDGDTMVIGGIITDNKNFSRDGVPWLADLPIVGALFRLDVSNENRTTLYFFVTPHILEDENFADLAEISYKVKLNAADKIGADRVRKIDPSFGGDEGAVLEGFDIPLYRSPESGQVDPEAVGWTPERRAEALKTEPVEAPAGGGNAETEDPR